MVVLRILGAILFAGGIGCAIASSIVLGDMVEDINRVSELEKQETPSGFQFGKLLLIKRKYRQLCPGGVRNRSLNRLTVVGMVLFLVGFELMLGFRFP